MSPALAASLARGFVAANRVRLALTLACIALGVALAGAVHTVHTSALAEVDRAARALSGAADLEIRGPRSGFDDALFAAIASRPEVEAAAPILEVHAAVAGGDFALRVLGIDPFRAIRLQPAFVARAASTGSSRAGEIIDAEAMWLSPAALARLKVRPGDKVTLVTAGSTRAFPIAGVLAGLEDAGAVAVMDIAAAQQHFGRIGRLSRIEVRLRPGAGAGAIRGLLPAGLTVSGAASISGRAASISRAYRVNLGALALVALATGAFLVFSTLALQAARRRQEFALLRALGVTRRELTALMVLEGGAIGAAGAVLGTLLGLAGSRALLGHAGADLGAGFFEALGGVFSPDPAALVLIALLGIAVGIAGAAWVARAVARMEVAEALRDRAFDVGDSPLFRGAQKGAVPVLLFAAGIPLLFVPPVLGLPLAGYAAIALWLAAAVAAVAPLCRALLGRLRPARAVPELALAQVRHLPGHLAASAAGIVVSASLCVAMAIMVHSFRHSFEGWLHGVVGADVYVRPGLRGDAGYFTLEQQRKVAQLPEVAAVEPLRYDRLVIAEGSTPFTLVARPLDARILAGFQAAPPGLPERGDRPPVWITEAARDLHGWNAGDAIELPIAGRRVAVRVAGVVRDYARTWGAVLFPLDEYRRLTGDTAANDLALRLRGESSSAAHAAIRAALGGSPAIAIEDAAGVRRESLRLFDRTFAVTYALEAIAIAIGLAGVTSSFAALAWSRRREFGVLRFLGLRRRDVLAMLALEGAATGALGALLGLVSGAAISLVLVHVVNRQSFHWGMEVHWPVAALAALLLAIVAACALGARLSGALAVRHEAVLAVKDDA